MAKRSLPEEVHVSRTVVIALDNSDLSARALPFARTIAHRWFGRLILVHATDPHHKQAHDPLERELADVVRHMREEGIQADAVLRVASPAQAIVDVANERHADLIVMASHQRHGLNRWLNGSVTEEVLARTSTPLLVVPALGEPPTTQSVRVLVPFDGTAVGGTAVEFLRGWSATRPMELLLLRVVSFGPIVVGLEPPITAQWLSPADIEAEVREAGAYLAGLVETIGDGSLSARRRVIETSEPVAKVILDTARRERVDTIVMGTHGKSGVSRLVLGSVSEEVLEQSPVPVLLVHQQAGVPNRSPGNVLEAYR
jgi:nucleotide-binding universal stress UspA family protein